MLCISSVVYCPKPLRRTKNAVIVRTGRDSGQWELIYNFASIQFYSTNHCRSLPLLSFWTPIWKYFHLSLKWMHKLSSLCRFWTQCRTSCIFLWIRDMYCSETSNLCFVDVLGRFIPWKSLRFSRRRRSVVWATLMADSSYSSKSVEV